VSEVAPQIAIDQIPGTKTTKRIVEALRGLADARGYVRITRAKLAAILQVAEGTLKIHVRLMAAHGLLARLGDRFVFLLSELARRPPPPREDAETEAEGLAAFADGCVRAGADPRQADPSAGPLLLARARKLSSTGALRGACVMQLQRIMGIAYVEDCATDKLREQNFPIHPKWIRPALDAISRGVVLRFLAERKRRQEARDARARETPEPDREAARQGALAILGALR
jgi:hypothetical protein